MRQSTPLLSGGRLTRHTTNTWAPVNEIGVVLRSRVVSMHVGRAIPFATLWQKAESQSVLCQDLLLGLDGK
jgi:hypothetical protein